MVWSSGRGTYERSLLRGRGPRGLGSCLAVHLLGVLPKTLALSLQCLQLLCGLVAGACGAPEPALGGRNSEGLRPGMGRPGATAQYLQVCDGGIQPVQPGPGQGAGVDTSQLLPDGGEESAGPLQVVQEQDHAMVTHCRQVGRSVQGVGWPWAGRIHVVGMGQPGVMESARGTELG